ncbi:hypothetical protein R3P38DRAFT_3234474 [Favolaschia claudopus]|uniref:BTB domain-containing protein n=1 Tax=Favolaschia claudopus TaxID=2862362 RepID=A0AAV9ZG75_9AGAR
MDDATAPSLHTLENGDVPTPRPMLYPRSESAPGSPASSSQYIPQEMIPKASFRLFGGMEGERKVLILKSTSPFFRSVIRSLADFDFKDKDTGMKE